MSETTIPLGLLDTAIGIIATVIFTLVGLIYRKLKSRIDDLEAELERQRDAHEEMRRDIEVAYTWMFGREEDPTNGGIAKTIERGFDQTEDEMDEIKGKLKSLINELVTEKELDIDRNDIRED
jgi:hypothetical protein